MIYIEIPYVNENNGVNKMSVQKEIQILNISENLKAEVFDAIYNQRPSGVEFEDTDLEQVLLLEKALGRLGIPYRQVKE